MPPSGTVRYGGALVVVALALAARFALDPLLGDRQPYFTFTIAVLAAAWLGGAGPALGALGLSLLIADFFFAPPRGSLGFVYFADASAAAAFAITGAAFVGFAQIARAERRRADAALLRARESTDELFEREERMRRLVDSNIIGVLFWDVTGAVLDCNDAFLALTGCARADVRAGRVRWTEIVAPDALHLHTAALEEIRERGECEPFETWIVSRDGRRVPILCGGVSFDPQGERGVTFVLEISEIRRIRDALTAEEARYRALFEDSPVVLIEEDWSAVKRRLLELRSLHSDLRPLFATHPEEVWACFRLIRVRRVNRAGRELLGLTPESAPADLSTTVSQQSVEQVAALLVAVSEGRGCARGEEVFFTPGGERRQMVFQLTALPGHEDDLDAVLLSLVDVTEERAIAADRQRLLVVAEKARAEAEAANKAKDQFLAMLGHELRNPFAAVRNAVATARLDPSRQERALEIAARQCDQLGRLIDDLLDVARITQSRINLRREHVSLAYVVRRAAEAMRDAVEERGHHLSLSLPEDDVIVPADPARLEQVLVNLLANAAKYTEPGGRIDVVALGHEREAIVRVRDTGMGIAPEVLPHVFDLFAQGERTLDRAQGGLGIGLTLVRKIVELHGGRVSARSEGAGKGAEFEIAIPVAATRAAVAGAPQHRGRVGGRSARIIVVDDNVDAAETLRVLLETLGHDVREFHDGASALESAVADPPDVMLVDIGLPGMNGYEVARRARRSAELAGVRLVALTGYGLEEDRRRSAEAGFDAHLVKPVDVGTLQEIVPAGADEPQTIH